jgi:alpha-beta hydrolase superfamily lysophospholipase
MFKKYFCSLGLLTLVCHIGFSNMANAESLFLEKLNYPLVEVSLLNATATGSSTWTDIELQTGFYRESESTQFRGCVLYLEGLGDSVKNHIPLYKALSKQGYRTIFFDYFGQGGSGSSMNNTRIVDLIFPALQISNQAKFVWNHYSEVPDYKTQKSCHGSPKKIVGWSTGGLAAYGLAAESWADAVVLIAPGISVKKFIGEAAVHPEYLTQLKPVITLRTLTKVPFALNEDPHLDPVKPNSPTLVPMFAANLIITSEMAQLWSIPKSVAGLVFLSGPDDTYVKANRTLEVLSSNASHFGVVNYVEALHEIDNEVPKIAQDFQQKMIAFFNSKP